MAHGHRFMQQVSTGYAIRCRICRGPRQRKRFFATAKECHSWWRKHVLTEEHLFAASPEGRAAGCARQKYVSTSDRFLADVFGVDVGAERSSSVDRTPLCPNELTDILKRP